MESSAPTDRPPSRTPRDMLISLVVLLVPVLLFVGIYQVLAGRNQPVEVDPLPALASAAATGMDVISVDQLPAGWVPMSAVFQPGQTGGTVRVGYVTPDGGSVQLVQSTVPAERLLPDELPEPATPAGTEQLAGRPWQVYPPQDGERALVLLEPEQTILVKGSTSAAELRQLAEGLGLP